MVYAFFVNFDVIKVFIPYFSLSLFSLLGWYIVYHTYTIQWTDGNGFSVAITRVLCTITSKYYTRLYIRDCNTLIYL